MAIKNRLKPAKFTSFYREKRNLEKDNKKLKEQEKDIVPIKLESLSDGGNLRLQYNRSGTFHWRHGYKIHGKSKTKTIGSYPEMSLSQARVVRDDNNAQIRRGIDPIDGSPDANTFKEVALLWYEYNYDGWKENHAKDIWRNLENNVFNYIGDVKIDKITPTLIKGVLKKKEKTKKLEMLKKLRQWCNNIFMYAQAEEITTNNPTAMLNKNLKKPLTKKPFNSINLSELPELVDKINNYKGNAVTIAAIKLAMLTFLRTRELIHGKWSEIDFQENIWTIPAIRMKWYRRKKNFLYMDFVVPLSKQSIKILKELYKETGKSEYIFARTKFPRNKPISNGTLLGAIKTHMGFAGRMTVHGFRHFASTHIYGFNNNGVMYEPRVIERQLSHGIGDAVSKTYNTAEYLPERKKMMQHWADFIDENSEMNK